MGLSLIKYGFFFYLLGPAFRKCDDDISNVAIREYQGTELPCNPDYSKPVNELRWFRVIESTVQKQVRPQSENNVLIARFIDHTSQFLAGGYEIVGTISGGSFTLKVLNVTYARDLAYYCCFSGDEYVRGYRVDPQVPVETAAIVQSVVYGQFRVVNVSVERTNTLTCRVKRSNPPPSFQWTIAGKTVTGPTVILPETHDGLSSAITFTPTRAMADQIVKCSAKNKIGLAPDFMVNTSARLNVLFAPVIASVLLLPIGPVVEGSPVQLLCKAEGNPIPALEWTPPEKLRSDEETWVDFPYQQSLGILSVNRNHNGEYCCQAINSEGQGNKCIDLDVLYPPEITIHFNNNTNTLECRARGNPPEYVFDDLQQRRNGQIIATLATDRTHTSVISHVFKNVTAEDTGTFVCSVSNGVKGKQHSKVVLDPKTPPLFDVQRGQPFKAKFGDSGKVSVMFYSQPPFTNLTWRKIGRENVSNSELFHLEEQAEVPVRLHNVMTTLSGFRSTVYFSQVVADNYGKYEFNVTNSEGERSCHALLVLERGGVRPRKPDLYYAVFEAGVLIIITSCVCIFLMVLICAGLLKLAGLSVEVKNLKDKWRPPRRLSYIYYTLKGRLEGRPDINSVLEYDYPNLVPMRRSRRTPSGGPVVKNDKSKNTSNIVSDEDKFSPTAGPSWREPLPVPDTPTSTLDKGKSGGMKPVKTSRKHSKENTMSEC